MADRAIYLLFPSTFIRGSYPSAVDTSVPSKTIIVVVLFIMINDITRVISNFLVPK
jgi:hypothetical protein